MTILTAFFDESGTHQGARALTVAGYVSTVEGWIAFEKDWRHSMSIYEIERFHMTDFVAGQRQFKDWPSRVKTPRLHKLIDIVNQHAIAAIGIGIPMDLYGSLSDKDRAICGSPYRIAAMQCCMEVARWAKQHHPDAQVAYVFEAGAQGAGKVSEFFRNAMSDPGTRSFLKILSFKFEPKQEFVPFQAADILAYELYQNIPRLLGTNPRPPRVENYNRLRRAKWSSFLLPTQDNLRVTVQAIVEMGLEPRTGAGCE